MFNNICIHVILQATFKELIAYDVAYFILDFHENIYIYIVLKNSMS